MNLVNVLYRTQISGNHRLIRYDHGKEFGGIYRPDGRGDTRHQFEIFRVGEKANVAINDAITIDENRRAFELSVLPGDQTTDQISFSRR